MKLIITLFYLFLSTSVFSQFLLIDTVAAYTDSEGIVHAETNKLQFNIHAGFEYFTDWEKDYKDQKNDSEFNIKYQNLIAANAGIRFNLWREKMWLEGRGKLYSDVATTLKPIHADLNFYLDYNLVEKLYLRLEANVDQNIENNKYNQFRSGDEVLVGLYYNYIVNNGIDFKMQDPVSVDFYAGISYLLHHKYLIGEYDEYKYMYLDWPESIQTIIGLRINLYKNIFYFEQNMKMYTEINGWISFTPYYTDYTTIIDARIKDVFLRFSHTCYHPVASHLTISENAVGGSHSSIGIVYNLIR